MNTTNHSEQHSADSFNPNPLGLAIGAGLALTATFGILAAYMATYVGSDDKRPVFWLTIGLFFLISSIISFIVAKARQ